jgi:hypothetical protein
MTLRLGIVVFAVWAASVSEVRGQSVMALGGAVSAQLHPNDDCQFACGLPGSASGLSFSLGYWWTPRVAIGTELSFANDLRGPQQLRVPGGHVESKTRHQDITFSGIAQWSLRPIDHAINGVLVGGVGVAYRETHRSEFRVVDGLGGRGPRNVSDYMPSIVGGFDLPYRVYRRVSIVSSVRVHYLFDGDGEREYPERGVDNVILNVGAKVAVQF